MHGPESPTSSLHKCIHTLLRNKEVQEHDENYFLFLITLWPLYNSAKVSSDASFLSEGKLSKQREMRHFICMLFLLKRQENIKSFTLAALSVLVEPKAKWVRVIDGHSCWYHCSFIFQINELCWMGMWGMSEA